MPKKTYAIMRVPIAVDLVILTIQKGEFAVVLVRRGIAPFKGQYALPGGFVRVGEDLEAATLRELAEETGIEQLNIGHMEQLGTFGTVERDPRERIISIAYLAFIPNLPAPVAGGDAADAKIVSVETALNASAPFLAFDHSAILMAGVERCRAKLEYTALATSFLDVEFTIVALRKVYEAVWGVALDPGNFHRKVTKTQGFVEASVNRTPVGISGRPAQLFTKGTAQILHPPLLRG